MPQNWQELAMPADKYTWFRCNICWFEFTEDKAELCERCGKLLCATCAKADGCYGKSPDGVWGYICPRCEPVHAADVEVTRPNFEKCKH